MTLLKYIPALILASLALPAAAQDEEPPKPVTVSGSVGLVSDYRFRGVSQTDENLAVQGGITIAHESGLYIGTWGSNLAGWGTFGGANMELDLIAGYKATLDDVTVDVGATWYMYPGGFNNTDFIEPYVKVSGTMGPAALTAGLAYAPKQEALGAWYLNGASAAAGVYDNPGDKNDNLYVWVDGAVGVPNTPVTLKGHVGFSNGNEGLGPFATSVAPTGEYIDWLIGADFAIPSTPLTLGVAYVDTNLSSRDTAYIQPSFSKGQDGTGSIADGTVLFSLTAAF
ncbi:TorF family putative porin [Sphingomonas sp. IC4-52]|uniref:TorF family putative porin n=1 Tax=Sphingomonas sp. IC4-52 TaxID=2887202 RepID=UPI001D10C414|nr:TorF family putative porin [Sphingomonas sp. IC4-52]MCC2980628.1 TorF family putative porin [Sphingomonas sp. IC4-52]